jgi:lycopene cyclase domain-containing protein
MKEYTILALGSALATAALDRLLGTHLLFRKTFWVFLAVMYGFKLLANGYLTWRPIVLYDERFFLNIRLGTIPIEDFFFGFALIGLSVIFWEFFKRRENHDI